MAFSARKEVDQDAASIINTRAYERLNDRASVAKLGKVAAWKARRARQSLPDFFEFVMVEETKRTPLKLAPHQKVGMDFIMSHDRSVNIWPVGHSKTFVMAALSLFLLGQDPTTRGAVVSATQGQASKVVSMVQGYLESSAKLRLVFPNLRPSKRRGDPWTTGALTVDRPPAIRDASMIAVGVDGNIAGSRLNWIVIDDILSRQNTSTKDQRDKVYEWFDSSVLSRLDPRDARVAVTNTAWHPDDLCHRLKGNPTNWPTMRMDMLGEIEVLNTEWDSPFIRPANENDPLCRLIAHDPDPRNETLLWPEVRGPEFLQWARDNHLPYRFNQLFRGLCRDDGSAKCKIEWIDQCKKLAQEMGFFSMVSSYDGPNPTFTGVDLAVKPGEEHDDCALFTFEVLPSGHRRILDIEVGQYDGPTIVQLIIQKAQRYNSVVLVEDNGAQAFIRQFALDIDASLSIQAHYTGGNKSDPYIGVETLFIELANKAWIIPTDARGQVHPHVQRFIDACLYYQPSRHTDDVLMACWFAKEKARQWGLTIKGSGHMQGSGNIAASFMAR